MSRKRLLASSAMECVLGGMPKTLPAQNTILRYLRPGKQHTYLAVRNDGEEIHIIDNLIVMLNDLDVGEYKMRYSTYAKMDPIQKEWVRFNMKCFTLRSRERQAMLAPLITGIINPLYERHRKHLAPGYPWFPYNPMGAGA